MLTDGGGYFPSPPPFPFNFHLLEVTLISAQDLFPSSRSMRTYAVAWLRPDHRLRTRLDAVGHTEPTWNDKFVFRVDDSTLRSDTSAIHVDIYAARPRYRPGSDTLLGTSRAILSTLRPSPATNFVALQIRRPSSLRPQGILNIGVALIDAYVRSLPIYADLGASAFAYHDLMARPAKKVKALLLPQERGEAGLDKNGSGGGVGEKERVALEKKLKKWRSEIPAMEVKEAEVKEDEGSSRGKPRRPRALSCFSIARQYTDDIAENDASSRSSSSRRR
ncbi:hypothetical protein IEQ34_018838 [Dendrobium chrysotoxum]|uniref:C2 domain-containing protein n=1 Tax=Dendrobium chrysotoxum TaxID=161865 RepID=A0AAV7G6E5_DENCH|nr:hypothetical protein IEQ34_018838 [Dendrobium chrysotoxum]